MVGAHLDSVIAGPGINDNGSGTSTILEIAEQLAALKYTNKLQRQVRFAFWGAEELGPAWLSALRGQPHARRRQAKIYANLNFDMVGSPNYVRFVYDGDGSASEPRRAAWISRASRTSLLTTSIAGPCIGADRLRWPVRLRAVHRGRHSSGRALQWRRGHQDCRGGRHLRRYGW